MVYITGDTHGDFDRVLKFIDFVGTTTADVLIILGDAGFNYYEEGRRNLLKSKMSRVPLTFFCIHGNHERRPESIATYHEAKWHGGTVYEEDAFSNLIFAKDGEVYNIGSKSCLVIGGAYSVDKAYRTEGESWWADEQPSEEIKQRVERKIVEMGDKVDVVLTHTCPFRYIPWEMFLSEIKQEHVDNSTELWLDKIEEKLDYSAWYCGHYHTNKKIDKLRFLFDDIKEF